MSSSIIPWVKRWGAALVMAVGLCVVSAASHPAEARVWVGVNFGVPWGWGYAPGYYYRPYPAYYYNPAPYHPDWRWRHWCWQHPYRCHW
jgi:hypothetical protein